MITCIYCRRRVNPARAISQQCTRLGCNFVAWSCCTGDRLPTCGDNDLHRLAPISADRLADNPAGRRDYADRRTMAGRDRAAA